MAYVGFTVFLSLGQLPLLSFALPPHRAYADVLQAAC